MNFSPLAKFDNHDLVHRNILPQGDICIKRRKSSIELVKTLVGRIVYSQLDENFIPSCELGEGDLGDVILDLRCAAL